MIQMVRNTMARTIHPNASRDQRDVWGATKRWAEGISKTRHAFDEQMRSSHVQVIPYLPQPTGGRVIIIGGEQSDLQGHRDTSGELEVGRARMWSIQVLPMCRPAARVFLPILSPRGRCPSAFSPRASIPGCSSHCRLDDIAPGSIVEVHDQSVSL